jgi:hypothetical protein
MSDDMVSHPPHYTRGPRIDFSGVANCDPGTVVWDVECIEVVRHIHDFRLANAMKYIWRVAFGGKDNDSEDIDKAIWYLQDYLDHEVM